MRPADRAKLAVAYMVLVASVIGASVPAGAQALEPCDVDAFLPFIRREGIILSQVVVVGEAHAECPASDPAGTVTLVVCVDAPYLGDSPRGNEETCGFYPDTDGVSDGYAKAKCFADQFYTTEAVAGGEDVEESTVGVVAIDQSPRKKWGEESCPKLDRVQH